jgi:hypothetical protein
VLVMIGRALAEAAQPAAVDGADAPPPQDARKSAHGAQIKSAHGAK